MAAGSVYARMQFTNTSGTTCLLRGAPRGISGVAPTGRRVELDARPAPRAFTGMLVAADMRPGHHVDLILATQDVTCTHAPVTYRDLDFHLPGGRVLRSRAHLRRFCDGWRMSGLGLPPRFTDTVPPKPGTLDALRPEVTVAPTIRSGGSLHYLVTLTNPTHTPVRLTPCPSYTEQIYLLPRHPTGTHKVVQHTATYYLNCEVVHQIGAGQHVHYRMQITLPKAPPGLAKLAWHLNSPREPTTGRGLRVTH
jgi:hypothetical protein